jgi:peptide chain release factor
VNRRERGVGFDDALVVPQHRNKAVALERLALLLRASQDVAAIANQRVVHSNHDRLERWEPGPAVQGEGV